ncbi:MAG TPA: hypothetical protein VH186_24860 [Chloroflexia bacterium]|nr:hypothetical protein [Chloroflexia bacterium]
MALSENEPSSTDPKVTATAHLGEPIEQVLDFDTWEQGNDLASTYARIEQEVRQAVGQEERVAEEVRQRILPMIRQRPGAPPGAGLYAVTLDQLKWAHSYLLFNGLTMAADGTVATHETLLMTMAQIGVCTVSYAGDQSEFRKQLFRRDMRLEEADPVEEMASVLEQRRERAALGYEDTSDELNQLLRRGLMEYAERGFLLREGKGHWLMGHGSPVPKEMLVGTSTLQLVEASLTLLRELILGHRKFVYVPSSPRDLVAITLGNALSPLQFMIVDTLYDQLEGWIRNARYPQSMGRKVRAFVEEVGPQVVRGVYRAASGSPPYVFYAHADHAQEAALIALADSVLQEYRGFPMLLSIADNLCRASFEPASFQNLVQQSYAAAGQPFRYLTERETRR